VNTITQVSVALAKAPRTARNRSNSKRLPDFATPQDDYFPSQIRPHA
jgi:hypothetical protein